MSYSNKNIFAALPRTTRGTPLVLGGDPKGKTFLYTNGNSVIIRDIEDPAIADIYTEHSCQVNVAKYSPSGFYIASGDVSGKVRIWDTVNKEHILKNEFQPIGGPIKDIAWSPDNQRMCVVGDGRERFGHVFMSETGTSVGEISKQSKPLNSVDFRPARPFRIATASEDNTVAIFEGPPFKFKCTKSDHTRFVQSVRYSPSGNLLASAGFDGHIYLYDGASSELKLQVGSPAHKGGVYGVAWSPDGTQLLSCSGDKTCKLWDAETGQVVTEFPMGTSVDDQQVACLWQGSHLLSVSLSGAINYLDVNNPEKPKRILRGHSKPITALTVKPPSLFTASHDGKVAKWNANTGESVWVGGTGHGNQINGMQISGDELLTCGIDDSLRTATVEAPAEGADDPQYTDRVLALGSQPRCLAHNTEEKLTVIVTVKELLTIKDGKKLSSVLLESEAHAVALRLIDSAREVAVGLSNNSLKIWSVGADGTISGPPKYSLTHRGPVTSVRYSPDGKLLAAGDGDRKVILYNADNEYKHFHNKEWGFHAARVNCVGWSTDGVRVASGSLDTSLIVWSPTNPSKHLIIKNAHPQSQITALEWIDSTTLVSVGQDANTKIWNIDFQ